MSKRQARNIRRGILLASLYLDPVVGNNWYARAAYSSGSLTARAFDEWIHREFRKRDRRRAKLLGGSGA